jgi:hypothetical protein
VGGGKTYLAASVPRFIRMKRLGYLPSRSVVGCWYTKDLNDNHFIFDVIMLPPELFLRAKGYLAVPETAAPALQMVKFDLPYVLKGIRELVVPHEQADPELFARDYFRNEFHLADTDVT